MLASPVLLQDWAGLATVKRILLGRGSGSFKTRNLLKWSLYLFIYLINLFFLCSWSKNLLIYLFWSSYFQNLFSLQQSLMPKRLLKLRPDLSSSGWDLLRAFTSRYLRADAKLLQEHVCNSTFSLALVLGYGVAVQVMFLLQGTALCVLKLFGLAGSHRGRFSVRCLQGVSLACSSWVLHILNNTWTSGALLGFKTWHLILWLLKKKKKKKGDQVRACIQCFFGNCKLDTVFSCGTCV